MNLRILPVAALLLAALAPPADAAGPADLTPGNRWADATFTLAQPDLRTIQLTGELLFYEYDVEGSRYTADDMGEAYVNAATFTRGPAKGNELVEKIEVQARSALDQTLAAAFPTATRTVHPAVVDRSTLRVTGGNEFDPGVRITVGANVVRTNEDLGLGSYSDEAIAAVFAAGATVRSTFSLSSQAGYGSVYHVQVPASPAGLVFADAAGEGATLSPDGKTLTVRIDNAAGTATLTRAVAVSLKDATAVPPTEEDIRATVDIALGELKGGANGLPVKVDVAADVRSVSLAQRYPGILPGSVKLDYLSADALRALRAAGAISDEHLRRGDEALLATIRDNLNASFEGGVTVTGGLSKTDLSAPASRPYDAEPPVRFAAGASAAYSLSGGGAENLDLALRLGAKVTFDVYLFSAKGRETTFLLHPPPGVSILKAKAAILSADGRTATFKVPPAEQESAAYPVTVTIREDDAPTYSAQKAELAVVVDLKDLDITLGGAVGGDMGDLVVDVAVTGNLGVIAIPADLKAGFGGSFDLDYLASDGVRLLRERGLLDDANLSMLEDQLLGEVKKNLGSALGADVEVSGGFDRASLDPKLVGEPLGGDKPIVFKAQTSFRKSLAGAPAPQAAIALYTQQQSFVLPKVQGLDTTYTVILPRGLAVTDLQAEGGESKVGEADDGRSQFTVTPSREEAKATVSMAVTPTFVVIKFWPVLLLALMVLVLLVGTPVALVMRGRKKKGAKAPAAKPKK